MSPPIQPEERTRLLRLPVDTRTLDAPWDDIEFHSDGHPQQVRRPKARGASAV